MGNYSQEEEQLRMMREVSEGQKRLHKHQMEIDMVIGLIEFSDLILASCCRATCARISALGFD